MSSLLARIKEERKKAKSRAGGDERDSSNNLSTFLLPAQPPLSPLSSSASSSPHIDQTLIAFSSYISPISTCKVSDVDNIYYIPNAIDSDVATALQAHIDSNGLSWTQLKTRKLKCFEKGSSGSTTNDDSFPRWLQTLCDCLIQYNAYHSSIQPNHVLINRYEEGEGIPHHTDGPAYHDQVAIISLGSPAYFTFKRNVPTDMVGIVDGKEDIVKLVLEPNSLLIFNGSAYSDFLHGIEANFDPSQIDVESCDNKPLLTLDNVQFSTRTSLTIRKIIRQED